jgi:hypothetical protein
VIAVAVWLAGAAAVFFLAFMPALDVYEPPASFLNPLMAVWCCGCIVLVLGLPVVWLLVRGALSDR